MLAHATRPAQVDGSAAAECNALGGAAMAGRQPSSCDVNTVRVRPATDNGGDVTSKAQRLALAFVVATAACAHAGPSRSPAPSGPYRFSGVIPGFAEVTGSFEISPDGRVGRFIGTCRTMEAPSPDATSTGCRVQPRSIAGRGDSTVWVGVKVVATETTPSSSDPTRSGVPSVRLRRFGTASAERVGR